MSDDFGTVNVRGRERAREIEVMRQHYRKHREALVNMTAEAPTEYLATEYQRLIREIDNALRKLDELESRPAGSVPPPPIVPPPQPKVHTGPGERPLVPPPALDDDETQVDYHPPDEPRARMKWHVPAILGAVLLFAAIIGGLVWWASKDDPADGQIVETDTAPITETQAPATETQAAEPAAIIAVTPPSTDYGVIRKGTRATRQFEIANNGEQPITIEIARSQCRCLYYEHSAVVPPRGKESVTVTIDGARAERGPLRETVRVTSKAAPSVATSFDVIATVQ